VRKISKQFAQEIFEALRDARQDLPDAAPNRHCHAGICPATQCGRCRRATRVRQVAYKLQTMLEERT
jgi:hypothetical protein